MVPEVLDGWTLDVVRALAAQNVFENDRFDFKERLLGDDQGKRRLRRTIAAFANTRHGYLVFGVRDDRTLTAHERLVGVDSTLELPEHFGAHASAIQPSVDWSPRLPALMLDNGRLIHVIEIRRSRRRPHVVFEDDRVVCMKRTNRGNEAMSLEEMRAAFVDDDRRQTDMAWLRSEVQRIHDTAQRINVLAHSNSGDRVQIAFTRYRVDGLRQAIPRIFTEIGHQPILVRYLNDLVERCSTADEAVAPLAAFESLPKDRSYSGGGALRVLDVVRDSAPQIVINAGHVLKWVDGIEC